MGHWNKPACNERFTEGRTKEKKKTSRKLRIWRRHRPTQRTIIATFPDLGGKFHGLDSVKLDRRRRATEQGEPWSFLGLLVFFFKKKGIWSMADCTTQIKKLRNGGRNQRTLLIGRRNWRVFFLQTKRKRCAGIGFGVGSGKPKKKTKCQSNFNKNKTPTISFFSPIGSDFDARLWLVDRDRSNTMETGRKKVHKNKRKPNQRRRGTDGLLERKQNGG